MRTSARKDLAATDTARLERKLAWHVKRAGTGGSWSEAEAIRAELASRPRKKRWAVTHAEGGDEGAVVVYASTAREAVRVAFNDAVDEGGEWDVRDFSARPCGTRLLARLGRDGWSVRTLGA